MAEYRQGDLLDLVHELCGQASRQGLEAAALVRADTDAVAGRALESRDEMIPDGRREPGCLITVVPRWGSLVVERLPDG